jgi:hypothetical protein
MGKSHPSPNDQRSNAKNPTSADHKAAMDNRSRQLDPKSKVYESSRSSDQKEE